MNSSLLLSLGNHQTHVFDCALLIYNSVLPTQISLEFPAYLFNLAFPLGHPTVRLLLDASDRKFNSSRFKQKQDLTDWYD
jgi:hypothetical protein